jgi:hypothetical protein
MMGMQSNDQNQTRRPDQQQNTPTQQKPAQQNQQQGGQMGQGGQRIDTDGDGRTRDANDTRPTDQGGKAPPVQR